MSTFEDGVRAVLDVFARSPALIEAFRDGKPLNFEINGSPPVLTMKANGHGRSADKLERQLGDARAEGEKVLARLKAKDAEIAALKSSLDGKSEELRRVALAAERGELKVVVADLRR